MKNLSLHKITFFAWLLMCYAGLTAQQSYRQQIYQYYLTDKISDWEQVMEKMRNNQASLTGAQQIDLVGYYYGYIGWTVEEGKNTQAKKNLELAEELLDKLLVKYPEMPELYAFKGAFTGYRITMNSIRAVVLGPKSMKNINHALDIGPDRPQPWIEKGNALFYMPKMFGGSKEEAIKAYVKAKEIMEQDPGMIKDNWMYLNVLLILGQAYEIIGQHKKAGAIYEKTLQYEPGFKTLKNEVYPAYIKKWEQEK